MGTPSAAEGPAAAQPDVVRGTPGVPGVGPGESTTRRGPRWFVCTGCCCALDVGSVEAISMLRVVLGPSVEEVDCRLRPQRATGRRARRRGCAGLLHLGIAFRASTRDQHQNNNRESAANHAASLDAFTVRQGIGCRQRQRARTRPTDLIQRGKPRQRWDSRPRPLSPASPARPGRSGGVLGRGRARRATPRYRRVERAGSLLG